jgi:hypothetical protein
MSIALSHAAVVVLGILESVGRRIERLERTAAAGVPGAHGRGDRPVGDRLHVVPNLALDLSQPGRAVGAALWSYRLGLGDGAANSLTYRLCSNCTDRARFTFVEPHERSRAASDIPIGISRLATQVHSRVAGASRRTSSERTAPDRTAQYAAHSSRADIDGIRFLNGAVVLWHLGVTPRAECGGFARRPRCRLGIVVSLLEARRERAVRFDDGRSWRRGPPGGNRMVAAWFIKRLDLRAEGCWLKRERGGRVWNPRAHRVGLSTPVAVVAIGRRCRPRRRDKRGSPLHRLHRYRSSGRRDRGCGQT